jgi:hypothetical protein
MLTLLPSKMSPFRRFCHAVLTWSGPVLLVFIALYQVVEWQSESWWFASAGYGAQFRHLMLWRGGIFVLGAASFALWLGFNAHLAWKSSAERNESLAFFGLETSRRFIPPEDKWQLDGYRRHATFWVIALFSWLAGLAFSERYLLWLRAAHAQKTGVTHAASGFDLQFFLFQLPLLEWISRFCLVSLVAALLLTGAIYLYEEMIGPSAQNEMQPPEANFFATRHLGVLWALLLIWKGADCLLRIPASYVSSGNVAVRVFDPLDVRFGWTAWAIFALSAPAVALLSGLAIARQPRARTFGLGLLWFVGAVIVPPLLPIAIDSQSKDENWRKSLTRHIQSTRNAWGLGAVERQNLKLKDASKFESLAIQETASGALPVAAWPASVAQSALQQRMSADLGGGYVTSISLERDAKTLIYRAVAQGRASLSSDLRALHTATPGAVWEMAANRARSDGSPIITAKTRIKTPFGPELQWSEPPRSPLLFAADSPLRATEPDWILSDAPGMVGVSLRSWWTRLAIAVRFFEPKLLRFAPREGEKIAWHRGAATRCARIAPFLDWSESPRPIWLSNAAGTRRLVWIATGVVWSDDYPDSATPAALGTAPPGANYGRHAAIGVVDSTTGSVTLFALDNDEPMMALYRRAFPGVFAPAGAMPRQVAAQIRPSQNLLRAQSLIWARYHESDAISWAGQKNNLRPLLSPAEGGDSALRPLAGENGAQWMLMALSAPNGQAGAAGAASPLSAILGWEESEWAARRGQARIVEWRPETPVTLPALVAEPSAKYEAGRARWPRPTLISVVPRFAANGSVSGFLTARGELKARPENGSLNAKTPVLLSLEASTSGEGAESLRRAVVPASAGLKRFKDAQIAWQNLRQARQKGDWDGVGRAENALNRALGTP